MEKRFRIGSGDRFLPTGKSSISTKGRTFLDHLYDYRLLMTKRAPTVNYHYDFNDPEYVGGWVLRNADTYLPNYTVSHSVDRSIDRGKFEVT
jgi:endo-beta-N-acetylglucosaminidase D